MDAAAALLGFRTVAAGFAPGGQESGMTSAAPAAPAATATLPGDPHGMEARARLPPQKRRGKKLGRALPLSQRPVPAALLQAPAAPAAASADPAPAPRAKISRFPQRLMEMLSDETIGASISWLPHGRSFLVHNPTKFTDEVLPQYFGACKFASFTRKLYRWGFRQISKGPDVDSFFHRQFRRDEAELCNDMICKEEIRDGCPELHGGINAYSLMRMEQADRLQELMKKNLDTKRKLDMARAIKLREQERVSVGSAAATPTPTATPTIMSQVHPSQVHLQAPHVPAQPKMATAAATVDLTGSPPPQLPGAVPGGTGLSRLPEGGGIGLVQRHLVRIEKRRSELQAVLQDEIIKRKTIADSKRRYTHLLAQQEEQYRQQQQRYYQEPPRPDRVDTVAESKRRYAELLARQGRLSAGLTPTVQAHMQATPVMAPAHTMPLPTMQHQLLSGQDQMKKAAEDVAITGRFYPSLSKHHHQRSSTESLKSCLKKSSSYVPPSSSVSPPFPGYSLLAKHHQQQQQAAADLLAQHQHHHQDYAAALRHPSPRSAQNLAILRASLEQQRREKLLSGAVGGGGVESGSSSHVPAAPGEKKGEDASSVVAAGVINRAIETLRREGFA